MKPRDLLILIALAAIWGASFLLMRLTATPFGPIPLVFVRIFIAALCLLPLLGIRGEWHALKTQPFDFIVVGILNSALPFCLLAFATLSLTGGFTSLLNATTPLMAALVGVIWWRHRLRLIQWIGLFISFGGVALLSWGKLSFKPGGSGWAIAAAIVAAFSYGVSANYTKKRLSNVSPLVISASSMLAATVVLLPFAVWQWPKTSPSLLSWSGAVALGVLCTAAAYLLYFRLLSSVGPTQAASVTFIVPVFAVLWGALFIKEPISFRMLAAMFIIISGTSLTNGLLKSGWVASGRPEEHGVAKSPDIAGK